MALIETEHAAFSEKGGGDLLFAARKRHSTRKGVVKECGGLWQTVEKTQGGGPVEVDQREVQIGRPGTGATAGELGGDFASRNEIGQSGT